jgi:uncharacterized membrane protein YtjA (UPF0391 family)
MHAAPMFSPTVLYLLGALIAGWLGFGALAGNAARAAKFLCVVLFVLFVVTIYRESSATSAR